MLRTPGVWEDIPKGARIVATRKGTTIEGTFLDVIDTNRDKRMSVRADGLGNVKLHAKDCWEVKFDQETLGEVIAKHRVGTVFAHNKGGYPRFIKLDHEYAARCMMEDGYHSTPQIVRLDQIAISPDYFSRVEV